MTSYRFLLAHNAEELVDFSVGGRPSAVSRYSVVLRNLDATGKATAVRVYDNSHGTHEHHMHRCDHEGRRRQPPELFHHGEPDGALRQARKLLEDGFEEMIAAWQR